MLPQQAAQLAEVYWMALTRDVPFSRYGEDEDTIAAAGTAHPRDNLLPKSGRSLVLDLLEIPSICRYIRIH